MNCPAADDLTRFRVAAATMSLMGQNIADMLRRNNVNIVENNEGGEEVQGDPSGCTLAFVDVKTKVPLQYSLLILKCNSQFNVNKT